MIEIGKINCATEWNKSYIKHMLKYVEKLKVDPSKKERLLKHECQTCFYSAKMGGSAITNKKCECCGKDMMFRSTNTDKYCEECAQLNNICKHCGGDINTKRRVYKKEKR